MPFRKGHKKIAGSGRKKGQMNHRTMLMIGVLERVADEIGGVERLIAWVKESRRRSTHDSRDDALKATERSGGRAQGAIG
jgi:hypothetical protein